MNLNHIAASFAVATSLVSCLSTSTGPRAGFCINNPIPARDKPLDMKVLKEAVLTPVPGIDQPPCPRHVLKASDGVCVPQSVWLPRGPVKAVVVFVPGLDGSSTDHGEIAPWFNARNVALYSTDIRGQGLWRGKDRGFYERWTRWVDDVEETNRDVRQRHPGVPVFLAGQSLGTVLCLAAAEKIADCEAPAGLLLHSPACALLDPKFKIRPMIALAQWWTQDEAAIRLKPLIEKGIWTVQDKTKALAMVSLPERCSTHLGTLRAFFRLGAHTQRHLAQVRVPVFMQFGCEDVLGAACQSPSMAIQNLVNALSQAPGRDTIHHPNGQHSMWSQPGMTNKLLTADLMWMHLHASF